MAADNLPLRDEKAGHGKLPEPFAKVRVLPKMYVKHENQTKKNKPSNHTNPNQNQTNKKKIQTCGECHCLHFLKKYYPNGTLHNPHATTIQTHKKYQCQCSLLSTCC